MTGESQKPALPRKTRDGGDDCQSDAAALYCIRCSRIVLYCIV